MKGFAIILGMALASTAFADDGASNDFSPIAGGTPSSALSQLKDLGAADATEAINLTVVLKSKDMQGLIAYANAVTDPNSPDHQHFLTTEEYCQRFGADTNVINLAMSYFAGKGITLAQNPACDTLSGPATVGQVNDAFQTQMENYSLAPTTKTPGLNVLTFSRQLMLPATFADSVSDVPSLMRITHGVPPTPAPAPPPGN